MLGYLLPLLVLGVTAAPGPRESGLRLCKTSERDVGVWVKEEDKFSRFTAKGLHFIDVTEELPVIARRIEIAFPTTATHQEEVAALTPQLDMNVTYNKLNTYSQFFNRHYRSTYGVEAANWLFAQVQEAAASNPAITVAQVTHTGFDQKSTIARIPGSEGDGVVVVSAHLDSVGSTSNGRAPGADDDGTGTHTILEVLRVLAAAEYAPKNTLEFHFYAAEEGGLLGSRQVMADYSARRVNVLALLNQDMTGWSPSNSLAIITDFTNASLNAYLTMLIGEYCDIPAVNSQCGYGCSDHASATSVGYPAAFVFEDLFENLNPYIHTSNDTIEKVSMDHTLQHAKLTLAFLVEASYI